MIFEVVHGCFGYGDGREVLRDLSFRVPEGKILSVLGPNGVGKTTLLRCMMGLLHWKKGESRIDGKNIHHIPVRELWKRIAYVPQAKGNALMYTAEEMVVLGRCAHLGMMQQPKKKDLELAREAIALVGVPHLCGKLCSQMSGGELQMVLIARALCAEPKLLVLDEPESNLDFRNQLIILETIRRLSREEGLCCIFNTHYPGHALRISDRALVLSREGTADFGEPSEVITREIMGRVFKVNVDIVDAQYDGMDYQAITAISLCNT